MKNITKIIGAGIISLTSLAGCDNEDSLKSYNTDLNGDGKIDFVEKDGKRYRHLINIGNNEYQEVELRIVDGIPFFRADKGYFNPWGQYLADDGKIVDLKSHRF